MDTAPQLNPIPRATLIHNHPELEKIPPELLKEIIEVFSNPKNGTPNHISKTGCLALARKGKEAWNAWRAVFPVKGNILKPINHADFSNHDFRENPINFAEFCFGGQANFQNAQFSYIADFQHTQFGGYTDFHDTQFGGYTDFLDAQFGGYTNFHGVQFGGYTNFHGAQFGECTNFHSAQFGNITNFHGAQFGDEANFQVAQFGDEANFQGTQFGNEANFRGTHFGNKANFQGTQWEQLRNFYQNETQWEKAKDRAKVKGLAPDEFQSINFDGVIFQGKVNFSNRKFKAKTNFVTVGKEFEFKKIRKDKNGKIIFNNKGKIEWEIDPDRQRNVQFNQAPLFHGCELHQDTSFDGAIFPDPTGNRDAARAYRTLKLAFNKQQATHEEQRFFKLEMEEEALLATGIQKWLFWLYKHTSDYGFSITKPLKIAGYIWLISFATYAVFSALGHCVLSDHSCEFSTGVFKYAIAQSMPVPGIEKLGNVETLDFGFRGIWWGAFDMLLFVWSALHKISSLIILFLIGLALRNLFKLK